MVAARGALSICVRPRRTIQDIHDLISPDSSPSADEQEVRRLYEELIAAWNRRDAQGCTAAYWDDASFVAFDGSEMHGRSNIESTVRRIFADGPTGRYVTRIRAVRFLRSDVALLRSVAGRVPPGQSDLDPALNVIQSLIATKQAGRWAIALFQNTPAALPGRPDLSEQLTEELREVLRRGLTRA